MALTGRTIMSVIPLCMRQRNPTQKIAHSTVFSRLKNKMPVIGHQLVTQNATGIPLESFSKDLLERFIVGYLLEDLAPSITSVQSMINPVCLIGAFWSRRLRILAQLKSEEKTPDTFVVSWRKRLR